MLSHLAGFRTVGIELDLLGSQLPPSVHIVTQVHPPEGALAQELPPPPRQRGAGCCDTTHTQLFSYIRK